MHFGEHFLATLDQRGVERAGAVEAFEHGMRDHVVFKESRLAVGDLVLERDPRLARHIFFRGEIVPVRQHRILHPIEVARVVDMPHEVDVRCLDLDRVGKRQGGHRDGFGC